MADNIRELINAENPRLVHKIITEGIYDENGSQIQTPAEGALVFGQNPGNELMKKSKNAFELMEKGIIKEVAFGGNKASPTARRSFLRQYLRCIEDPNNPSNPKYMQEEVNSIADIEKEKVKVAIESLITISEGENGKENIEIDGERFATASSNIQQRFGGIPSNLEGLKACKVPSNFEMMFLSEHEAARWYYVKNLKEYIDTIEGAEKQEEAFERLMKIDEIEGNSSDDIATKYAEHASNKGLESVAAIDATTYVKRKGLSLQKILKDGFGKDIPVTYKAVNFFPDKVNPNNFDSIHEWDSKWTLPYVNEAKKITEHMTEQELQEIMNVCEREEQEAGTRNNDEYDDGSK